MLAGVCVIWAVGGSGPAAAQTAAYKCGSHSYTQQACGRAVNTEGHGKPATKKDTAFAPRRLPGETDEAFALRRRRARLSQSDRDECQRLDTKIPFEQTRLKNSVTAQETKEAQESLDSAHKRLRELRC